MDSKDDQFIIRSAEESEWQEAMGVVWRTFLEFEGDEYPPSGVRNFNDFITGSDLYHMFQKGEYQMFVSYDRQNEKIVGVITLRSRHHISLLFVDKAYHHHGIGRALIQYVQHYLLTEMGEEFMTVNASPYAIGFYHKIGFCDLGPEKMDDGIIYTPMRLFL